jgi:LacI family transcriptional regulator
LSDIAEKLGISASLVSKVLNDRPGVWASEETRGRIRAAAREMGYRPNAAARALRSGKSRQVAFVSLGRPPDPDAAPARDGSLRALAERVAAHGYELRVQAYPDPIDVERGLAVLLQARSCDAVVLWGREADTEPLGVFLEKSGLPFAIKGRFEKSHPGWLQVDFDHEGMVMRAVEHLASLGHRRIATIGYPLSEPYTYCLAEGFRMAMETLLGETVSEQMTAYGPMDVGAAERTVLRWLALPDSDRPTAVVLDGSPAWHGVERALARHGRTVGDEQGGFATSGLTGPDFTLVFGNAYGYLDVDTEVLAVEVIERLLAPLDRGEAPEQRVIRLLPPLVPLRSLRFGDLVTMRRPDTGQDG